MTILAAALIAIGLADLIPRRRIAIPVALAAMAAVTALAGQPTSTDAGVLLAVEITGVVAWIVLRPVRAGREWLPLSVLGATIAVPVIFAPWIDTETSPVLDDLFLGGYGPWRWFDAQHAVLIVGLFLVMLATGNTIVRLMLAAVGATPPERSDRPDPSQTLKGGRILGPLERVFILGLGLAGQFTAAGLVIAAKGLIRWPELKAQADQQSSPSVPLTAHAAEPRSEVEADTDVSADEADPPLADEEGVPVTKEQPTRRPGIDEITEYFLVGSFVSWLVALTALVLGHP